MIDYLLHGFTAGGSFRQGGLRAAMPTNTDDSVTKYGSNLV